MSTATMTMTLARPVHFRIKLDKVGVTLPGVGRWGGHWIQLHNIVEMQILLSATPEGPHDHSCELGVFYRKSRSLLSDERSLITIPYSHFPDAQADLDAIAAAIAKL